MSKSKRWTTSPKQKLAKRACILTEFELNDSGGLLSKTTPPVCGTHRHVSIREAEEQLTAGNCKRGPKWADKKWQYVSVVFLKQPKVWQTVVSGGFTGLQMVDRVPRRS